MAAIRTPADLLSATSGNLGPLPDEISGTINGSRGATTGLLANGNFENHVKALLAPDKHLIRLPFR